VLQGTVHLVIFVVFLSLRWCREVPAHMRM
jgi:hypothetical protein